MIENIYRWEMLTNPHFGPVGVTPLSQSDMDRHGRDILYYRPTDLHFTADMVLESIVRFGRTFEEEDKEKEKD